MEFSQPDFDSKPTGSFSTTKNTEKTSKTKENSSKSSGTAFRKQASAHLDALFRFASILPISEPETERLLRETYRRTFEQLDNNPPKDGLKKQLFIHLIEGYRLDYASSDNLLSESRTERAQHRAKPLDSVSLNIMNDLDETFFSNISTDALIRSLKDLPDICRICIHLTEVEDFSYNEVVEILDCSPETVRAQLHQGRNILKRKLIRSEVSEEVLPTS